MFRVFRIVFFFSKWQRSLGAEKMLTTFPNISERLSLHSHCKMTPMLFIILFPPVLQILALVLSLIYPSQVGLEDGE